MNAMRDDSFRIYVEQLRDGQIEHLNEVFSPEFLDVHETELSFVDPVHVNGEAYLADATLILHLNIETYALMPCRVCNELIKIAIHISGLYLAVPLEEIKGGVFNFCELLRETILVEVPALAECNEGKCPQREVVQKFFKKEGDEEHPSDDDERYHPFADLEL